MDLYHVQTIFVYINIVSCVIYVYAVMFSDFFLLFIF